MRCLSPLTFCITLSWALPEVMFPFNSQVPPVARVGQHYEFQLSSTTFGPPSAILQYVLNGAPAWLSLDSSTRTLTGTPGPNDIGAPNFKIRAGDNEGSTDMPVTLVVVETQAPQAPPSISEYLAKAGSLSGPSSVCAYPNSAFQIAFPMGIFKDRAIQKLSYYATLVDHTPLPAWLSFDPNSLTFSGITPGEASSPQSFDVELIASDVVGFAGAWTDFTMVVSVQRLAFNTSNQIIGIPNGIPLEYKALLSQLTLNGERVEQSQIANATAQKPSWVNFDPRSLEISGNPSEHEFEEDVIITVVDNGGDQASIILHLQRCDTSANSTFLSKQQVDVNAIIGAPVNYDIGPSILAKSNLQISIDLGSATSWLQFNETDLSINGRIPTTVQPTVATATITARSFAIASSETETFHISVVSATFSQSSTATTLTSRLPPSASATSTVNGQIAASPSTKSSKMPNSAKIAISILFALILAFVALVSCQKLRRKRRKGSLTKISRPILGEAQFPSLHDSKQEPDIEKDGVKPQTARSATPDNPPQVALNLPNSRSTNTSRNRESQTSYLNEGEGTILSYHDRSSWGQAATEGHTPHHSMSIPTEIARRSRGSIQISPCRRERPRSSQLSQLHSRQLSGIGHGRHENRASQVPLGPRSPFDCMENSARGMMDSFPNPSAASKYSRATHDPRGTSIGVIGRSKSIRMVERSPATGTGGSSVLQIFDEEDDRPLEVRRQSYIRRRTASRSPFFSTVAAGSTRGSRAPSRSSSGSRYLDGPRPIFERSSSFFSGESNSILGHAIENLRRQRTQKSRTITRRSESSSLEHSGEVSLGDGPNGLAFPVQSMTASSSRQFESVSSFYSTDSSIGVSDFNIPTDVSPLEGGRQDQDLPACSTYGPQKRIERRHSGKRSAWAARLGRDYDGQIGLAPPLSTSQGEFTKTDKPSDDARESLTSSARMSQIRRSRLAAETRAWGRRLPLSPLKDVNASSGSSPGLERSFRQMNQESHDIKGKEIIGLGLTTGDDWETIHNRPSGSSQRLGMDETRAFL